MSTVRLGDVDAWRAVERPCSPSSTVVWGPVSATAAALAGCARGVLSVCIVPQLTPFLVVAALECIPHNVRAKHTDTVEVLAKRLGRSGFLDDAHVLRSGNGKRKRGQSMRVRLNETTYRAPRRKSWSVVVAGDPDGDAVALFNYNAYGRTADDVRCTAMPQPVFNLGVELWLAAMRPSSLSSKSPPGEVPPTTAAAWNERDKFVFARFLGGKTVDVIFEDLSHQTPRKRSWSSD